MSKFCIETIGNIRKKSLFVLFDYRGVIFRSYLMDDGSGKLISVNGALGYGTVDYTRGDVIINLIPQKELDLIRLNYYRENSIASVRHHIYLSHDCPIRHVFSMDKPNGVSTTHYFDHLDDSTFETFKYMMELVE